MIHVQHLLGIGHFVRARHLAAALATAGLDVHLVSGGMPVGGPLHRGVRLVQLPPIRVVDATFAPLCDQASRPVDDAFRERRRELLLAAYDAADPAAVIIETFPFGRRALRFELMPLVERVGQRRGEVKLVASVRDILQRQAKPEREREMLQLAGSRFDAVLVHGDPRLARFEESFSSDAPMHLAPPVHYTGYVGISPAPEGLDRQRDEVVISAGGGAVGERLLATALAAQAQSELAHLTWRVLAGPNLPDSTFMRLRRDAGAGAVVERSRTDLAVALRAARVSISQAGYNTALDVTTSGARAVMVPFADEGQTEQAARAERLAAHDLAIVVHERDLAPATLARAVDEAARRERWGRFDFAVDGARRTAELVAGMIGRTAQAQA